MSNPPDIYPTKITFSKCFLTKGTLLSPEKSVLNLSRVSSSDVNEDKRTRLEGDPRVSKY
jgi:hypothetical protein